MDIAFDFQIHNVPSREVADEIAADIMAVLAKKHSTEMVVTWEEV